MPFDINGLQLLCEGASIVTNGEPNQPETREASSNSNPTMEQLMMQMINSSRQQTEQMTALVATLVTNRVEYQVMPDLHKTLADFDGEGGSTKARAWLKSIQTTSDLHKWPESFRLESARNHCKGPATHWFSARTFESWSDFVDQFSTTFIGGISLPERWKRMQARTQQKTETTNSYFHEKVLLCQELGLDFSDVKRQVVVGLWSRPLYSMLMAKEHYNADQLLRDIRSFEETENERSDRIAAKAPQTARPTSDRKYTDRNTSSATNSSTATNTAKTEKRSTFSDTDKTSRKCYNCNRQGHISRDCPEPRKIPRCHNCKLEGHLSRDCTQVSNQPASSGATSSTNSSLLVSTTSAAVSPLNKLLKPAILKTTEVTAMLDPGSSSCTVRASAAIKCQLNVSPTSEVLFGFGNTEHSSANAIGQAVADVEIDGVVGKDVVVLIVPDNAQPIDLLVGRTWTELPHIAYLRVGDVFQIGYSDQPPFKDLQLPTMPEPRVRLRSDQHVRLEKNTMNFVAVSTDRRENGYGIFGVGSGGKDGLFQLTEGCTIVPMIGGTDGTTIKKGQTISRGELVNLVPVTDEDTTERERDTIKRSQLVTVTDSKNEKQPEQPQRDPILVEDIRVDSEISDENLRGLHLLLNEFRDCFAMSLKELGCTTLTTMDIEEVKGSRPVHCRPYKTNATDREAIAAIVKEWKEAGIVSETRSPYASPVLLVEKKTGERRLVVDYRKLNAQTVKDKFPLPSIDQQLEGLSGSKIYTVLDLAHGYLQLPLSDDAKAKTAFITPDETGQFERLIFGLVNGPSEFQRVMNKALGSLRNDVAKCYLDDVLIPAQDWPDMLSKLRLVLEALRKAGLTLRLSKCEFGKVEIAYLGFVIAEGGIRPGRRKMAAIDDFPRPKDVHQVRRFLGLTGFFRRFVKGYAVKTEAITRLTRKDTPFVWGAEQEAAFQTMKLELTQDPVLQLYNPNAKTELHTDASAEGLAGLLLQEGTDGKLHLVYCVSKKTTSVERNYHSSRLELMAVVWSVDRLRQFLLGISFTIVTDCQALVYLNTMQTKNPQIARWAQLLQEYDIEGIRHRAGVKMMHADALSRAPVEESADTLDMIHNRVGMYLTLTREEQVLTIQRSDEELRDIIEILSREKEDRAAHDDEKVRGYNLNNGLLRRDTKVGGEQRSLFVIPRGMRKSIVVKHHDLMGHFAHDRTVSLILNHYWFPKMRRYVRQHIHQCFDCVLNKTPSGKSKGYLHPVPVASRPFETINLDHLGPFVKSSRQNQFLLVIVDNMTKYVRLFPARNTSSENLLKAMKSYILRHGLPVRAISDRGTCFTSSAFETFCREQGIQHVLNSPRHPQGNGQVERVNRTLIPAIAIAVQDPTHRDWDLQLEKIERDLNCSINKTTGKSPFQLLHGYQPRFTDGAIRAVTATGSDVWTNPTDLQRAAHAQIQNQQRVMKTRYDSKHTRGPEYDVGEVVFMRRAPSHTGEPTKTQPKFRGPLVVTHRLPGDTYRVSQLEEDAGHFYASTAHASQLKGWKSPPDSMDDSVSERGDDDSDSDLDESIPRLDEVSKNAEPSLSNDSVREDEGAESDAGPTSRRAKRTRRKPTHLNDFV